MTHATDPQKLLNQAVAAARQAAERERANLTKLRNYDQVLQTGRNRLDRYKQIKRALFGSDRNDLQPEEVVDKAESLARFRGSILAAMRRPDDSRVSDDEVVEWVRNTQCAGERQAGDIVNLRRGISELQDQLDDMRAALMDLLKVDPHNWDDRKLLDALRTAWFKRGDRDLDGRPKLEMIEGILNDFDIPQKDAHINERIRIALHRYGALRQQLKRYFEIPENQNVTDGHLAQQVKAGPHATLYRQRERLVQSLLDTLRPDDRGVGFGVDDIPAAAKALKQTCANYRKRKDELLAEVELLKEGGPSNERDRNIVEAVKADRDRWRRVVDEACELMGYPLVALPDPDEMKRKLSELLTERMTLKADLERCRQSIREQTATTMVLDAQEAHIVEGDVLVLNGGARYRMEPVDDAPRIGAKPTKFKSGDEVRLTKQALMKHNEPHGKTYEVMQVFDNTVPVHYVVGVDSRLLVYETELVDPRADPLASVL